MAFAEKLRKRRLELGLTLKQVADALGVAESTISRYESKGIQNMGADKVEVLAQILHTRPANLLGWIAHEPFYQSDIDELNSAFEDYGLRIDLVNEEDPDWAVFYWDNGKYRFTRIPLEDLWELYSDLDRYSEKEIAQELYRLYRKHKLKEENPLNYINRTLSVLHQLNDAGQERVADYAEVLLASGKYHHEPKIIEFKEDSENEQANFKMAAYDGEEFSEDERAEAIQSMNEFQAKQEKNNK